MYVCVCVCVQLALATLLSGSLASQLSIKELLLFCQAPADPRNPTIGK